MYFPDLKDGTTCTLISCDCPGTILNSKRRRRVTTTTRSSRRAYCCPMQFLEPAEKGRNALRSASTPLYSPSHRSGMKVCGSGQSAGSFIGADTHGFKIVCLHLVNGSRYVNGQDYTNPRWKSIAVYRRSVCCFSM